MKKLIREIASRLVGIQGEDMTKAEQQIALLLVNAKICVWDEDGVLAFH